jgi:hypothetical protein
MHDRNVEVLAHGGLLKRTGTRGGACKEPDRSACGERPACEEWSSQSDYQYPLHYPSSYVKDIPNDIRLATTIVNDAFASFCEA